MRSVPSLDLPGPPPLAWRKFTSAKRLPCLSRTIQLQPLDRKTSRSILLATAALLIACAVKPGTASAATAAYRNPILADVADPFVLKHRGQYYLYRTEVRGGLDVFTSRDLAHWKPGPMVWRPDTPGGPDSHWLWAPEVYYENGRFLLFFAAGPPDGEQRLWRAVSDSPLGPFHTDPAGGLTDPWRIDVSLFQDEGAWYLYCCHRRRLTSSLFGARIEGSRIGVGSQSSLTAGALNGASWMSLLEPQQPWEGIWVEAPTVLKDRSQYYLLYSAPDAESPDYQVGYAVASSPLGPWQRRGILIPTRPGVPGPGHQSVVLAPDNLTPYLVYHRKRLSERGWQRDLMLDRLQIGNGRLTTRAPSLSPQPLPPQPAFRALFDGPDALRPWERVAGDWRANSTDREVQQRDPGATARLRLARHSFADGVVEVNLRWVSGDGALGVALVGSRGFLPIRLFPRGEPGLQWGNGRVARRPEGFDPFAYHQLLAIRRGPAVELRLDGRSLGSSRLTSGPVNLELLTERCAGAYSGIAITTYADPGPLDAPATPYPAWYRAGNRIEQRYLGMQRQRLLLRQILGSPATLSLRVQGWALGTSLPVRKYGVELVSTGGRDRFEAYFDPPNNVLATHGSVAGRELPWRNSDLPLGFDYTTSHTLSLQRRGTEWRVAVDGRSCQQRTAALRGPLRTALVTEDARCVFSDFQLTGKAEGTRRGHRRVPSTDQAIIR
jgi:glycosyl hydrolase family 43